MKLIRRNTVQPLSPCDWDQESFCTVESCRLPATHRRLVGVTADSTPLYELVCCDHAWWEVAK